MAVRGACRHGRGLGVFSPTSPRPFRLCAEDGAQPTVSERPCGISPSSHPSRRVTLSNPPVSRPFGSAIRSATSLCRPDARATAGGPISLRCQFHFIIDARAAQLDGSRGQGYRTVGPFTRPGQRPRVPFSISPRPGFALQEIDAAADVSDAGEVTLRGSTVIAGQRAKFETYVKSPARAAGEGSPATLIFESPVINVSFDGRLAAKNGLGLAGQVTATAADLRAAARWLGAAPSGERGFKAYADGKPRQRRASVQASPERSAVDRSKARACDSSLARPSAIAVSLETGNIDLNHYLAPNRPLNRTAQVRPPGTRHAQICGLARVELKRARRKAHLWQSKRDPPDRRAPQGPNQCPHIRTELWRQGDAKIVLDGTQRAALEVPSRPGEVGP